MQETSLNFFFVKTSNYCKMNVICYVPWYFGRIAVVFQVVPGCSIEFQGIPGTFQICLRASEGVTVGFSGVAWGFLSVPKDFTRLYRRSRVVPWGFWNISGDFRGIPGRLKGHFIGFQSVLADSRGFTNATDVSMGSRALQSIIGLFRGFQECFKGISLGFRGAPGCLAGFGSVPGIWITGAFQRCFKKFQGRF